MTKLAGARRDKSVVSFVITIHELSAVISFHCTLMRPRSNDSLSHTLSCFWSQRKRGSDATVLEDVSHFPRGGSTLMRGSDRAAVRTVERIACSRLELKQIV